MGRKAGSICAHRVAATLEARATDNPPDYLDAFEVPISNTRTPEQWARAVFENAPREVALVPAAGVARCAGPPARATAVVRSRSRLADRRNIARRGSSRTALVVDDRPTDPARCKLDGSLDHTRVLHTAPGTPALGSCRPDPSAGDSLPPRARRVPPTGRDALKHRLTTEVRAHRLVPSTASRQTMVQLTRRGAG
jgi:hypothetical protein